MTHLLLLEISFAQVHNRLLFRDIFRAPSRSFVFNEPWAMQEESSDVCKSQLAMWSHTTDVGATLTIRQLRLNVLCNVVTRP